MEDGDGVAAGAHAEIASFVLPGVELAVDAQAGVACQRRELFRRHVAAPPAANATVRGVVDQRQTARPQHPQELGQVAGDVLRVDVHENVERPDAIEAVCIARDTSSVIDDELDVCSVVQTRAAALYGVIVRVLSSAGILSIEPMPSDQAMIVGMQDMARPISFAGRLIRPDLHDVLHARLLTLAEKAVECIERAVSEGDGKTALALLKGLGLLSGGAEQIGSDDPEDLAAKDRGRKKFRDMFG